MTTYNDYMKKQESLRKGKLLYEIKEKNVGHYTLPGIGVGIDAGDETDSVCRWNGYGGEHCGWI